jgi:hypothetical protein
MDIGGLLGFRNYTMGYGVDEVSRTALRLYRRDDRADHCPHPLSVDHYGGRGYSHFLWTFYSQCLRSNSVDHRPPRSGCLNIGFLYRISHQLLWREGIGDSVSTFLGCGLEGDRKFGETIPGEERGSHFISLPCHPCFPYFSGIHFCRASPYPHPPLHPLYLSRFNISMFLPGICGLVNWSDIRKSGHPFRFGGDDRLHYNANRNGGCLGIPL